MKHSNTNIRVALALGSGLTLILLLALLLSTSAVRSSKVVLAQSLTAPRRVDCVNGSDVGDCIASPCQTIGYALNQAVAGDVIRVAACIYTESLVLNKAVSLLGDGADCTIIHALSGQRVMDIHGSTITNSTIISGFTMTGGDVSGRGGGIHVAYCSPTLSHNVISHNRATGYGGGFYVIGRPASPVLNNNRIISNTTSSIGGGVFIDDYSSPTLVNNVIAGNYARSNGDGVYIDYYAQPVIVNNTIVANNLAPDNWANEGIFMCNQPSPTIVNNIIVSHSCGIRGIMGSYLTITLDYNDVWPCGNGYRYRCYCDAVITGTHDISQDPRFVDAAHDDYHLLPDSPVIDIGANDYAPATDFDDEPRPLDGNQDGTAITDMGADEFRPPYICLVYLPLMFKNH